jgi:hypothetical protein
MDNTTNLNNLKKHIFFEFLQIVGRAFILVRYSENVVLGNRGFTAEEKENGIVLVFNKKMNFRWDDEGITATLVFGTSPQKCFVPTENIIAVYSSELNAQFVTSPAAAQPLAGKELKTAKGPKPHRHPPPDPGKELTGKADHNKDTGTEAGDNVIKVDFTKKGKK